MDILGRGESGVKALGAHRPACARKTHLAGWGDEARVERALVGVEAPHTFSSLPIPSLLQRSPAWMTRLSFSFVAAPKGRSMDGSPVLEGLTGFQGRSSQPGLPRDPSLHVQASACPPQGRAVGPAPSRCFSWKLPQKHCTQQVLEAWPCPLPPPQDTPAGATTGQRLHCLARPGRPTHISHHQIRERSQGWKGLWEVGRERPQGQGGMKRR